MKDMHSVMSAIAGIGPVVLAADNTPAAIDTRGYDAVEILLGIGIGGITFTADDRITIELSHSDDNAAYEAPAITDLLGVASVSAGASGYSVVKSLVAAHAAAADYRFGYVGGKRYLKLLFNFAGTHGAGTPLHAVFLGLHPALAPVAADM